MFVRIYYGKLTEDFGVDVFFEYAGQELHGTSIVLLKYAASNQKIRAKEFYFYDHAGLNLADRNKVIKHKFLKDEEKSRALTRLIYFKMIIEINNSYKKGNMFTLINLSDLIEGSYESVEKGESPIHVDIDSMNN